MSVRIDRILKCSYAVGNIRMKVFEYHGLNRVEVIETTSEHKSDKVIGFTVGREAVSGIRDLFQTYLDNIKDE